ncbi:MAG: helix-turn-helix domain-containing protein [Aigarchaeota archaeon]|nr:helix-turn-helix domain-containing protein [Aigarchaeota archaeon]MCX8192641.1 helix-turn-helix domain-containing protein [Nitrososphaeria archaeon]MDW7985601.1 helix-turn-helix domain-containing protein [Nitrososphaerota archaeon]
MKQKLGLKILKILIRNSDCRVVKFLQDKEVEAEFKKVRISEVYSTHLLKLLKPIEADKHLDVQGSYMILPDSYLWVETESCTSCRIFSKLPVIVESLSYVKPLGVIVKLIIPGRLYHKRVIEDLRNAGLDVDTLLIKDYEDYELTKRQREVLTTALKSGYFGSRRDAKLRDIASLIEADPSTASRIMRDAIKKVIRKTLEE